ncbi:MAG: succinyl-diaminopimelate desuccinylase [Pseudonocardiales bacterium]|nr:succinyl-diaminopimelate desuccinylase [Pseudonocardiales bacterium]
MVDVVIAIEELDLSLPPGELTAALVDIESVSGDEARISDAVEQALTGYRGLAVQRLGNVVIARTELGLAQRIVLAGHLDTVPIANNLPSRVADGRLIGCGTSDMKSGVALQLRAAHLIGSGQLVPRVDVTWLFYDCEEIEAARNGLNLLAAEQPGLLTADLAVLLEPTNGAVEGGCQGTMRAVVSTTGQRAHSARSWLGINAIHAASPVLQRLAQYQAREVEVEGLRFREGLNAVAISGGVAGNVVPDRCEVTVNFRFAPDRSMEQAEEHLHSVFDGFDLAVVDAAPAAPPGLDQPLVREFIAAIGKPAQAKLGWTDVARFAALGIPALNFGPGDPDLAHIVDESVDLATIDSSEQALLAFLAA